jgi:hypothetical protein
LKEEMSWDFEKVRSAVGKSPQALATGPGKFDNPANLAAFYHFWAVGMSGSGCKRLIPQELQKMDWLCLCISHTYPVDFPAVTIKAAIFLFSKMQFEPREGFLALQMFYRR